MAAQEETLNAPFLPSTPLDLPREPLDLPQPRATLSPGSNDLQQVRSDGGQENDADDAQVKTLLSWHAAGRPFRRRAKEYYMNIAVITLAVLVILFLFSQYVLMLVVLAVVFLNYALTTVAPHDLRYKLTTQGLTVENHFYYWDELFDFYFKIIEGEQMVYVTTRYYLPALLPLTLGDMHKDHIQSILLQYLPYREIVRPSFVEKAGEWLSRTFPLDRRPT